MITDNLIKSAAELYHTFEMMGMDEREMPQVTLTFKNRRSLEIFKVMLKQWLPYSYGVLDDTIKVHGITFVFKNNSESPTHE